MGNLHSRMSAALPTVAALYRFLRAKLRWCAFVMQFLRFRRTARVGASRFKVTWRDVEARLDDSGASLGFDRHYVFHTAWAARVLARTKPAEHVDISSTLYFCSIMSAFVRIVYCEYRPVDLGLDGLVARRADLLHLPFDSDSIRSLSCMHVLEHVGLGRYGDPLDPDGDLKAIAELKRALAPGGDLLVAVPIGTRRLSFNAQRIYDYEQFVSYLDGLELVECALVPDDPARGGVLLNPAAAAFDEQRCGCGCFWFRK